MVKLPSVLIDMDKIDIIVQQYKKLSDWCSAFWDAVYDKCKGDIACNAGCGICCELQSVNLLEAYIIYRALQSCKVTLNNQFNEKCVFLVDDTCEIYTVRPLICRTHGLAIKSREFTTPYSITCPYNFNETDLEKNSSVILDMDMITENSVRLNLAFCTINGLEHFADKRILMRDIASETFDPRVVNVFKR
ncbi:MAG: YkgJ family cysteine cluster protein [Fibrobacter sp.]|nr:YkgJ family cysteine cluster protein [Fibrobacter sp.]